MLSIYSTRLSTWQTFLKGSIDILGGTAILIVTSPLKLLIALVVKATSPGPVVFIQERVGLNKRRFKLFKFRTMVADATEKQKELELLNEAVGPVFKIKDDPRVTNVGSDRTRAGRTPPRRPRKTGRRAG